MSGLILAPENIWIVVESVDMRKGIDSLSFMVQQVLGLSPCAGSAFIFHNRPGNRLKVLLWDAHGVWLCQRRLHQGRFIWPKVTGTRFAITQEQWHWLIMGVDWQRLSAVPNANWEV